MILLRTIQRQPCRIPLCTSLRCLAFVAIAICVYAAFWDRSPTPKNIVSAAPVGEHPIDGLISNATATINKLLAKQTTALSDTAASYRSRRGRHPPPGFEAWHAFASAHNAILVEEFFDRIYDDLRPFWGIPAKQIRDQARQLPYRVVVRNGKVQTQKGERKRLDEWIDMVKKVQHLLPDLDMPLNLLDEPRVAVPWEDISTYLETGSVSRSLDPAGGYIQRFSTLDLDGETIETKRPVFSDASPYWEQIRASCAPDAPSRHLPAPGPPFRSENGCNLNSSMLFTYEGFVSNWTKAKDACLQPELLSSHGSLIQPLSQSTTHSLIPLFGSSKFSMNNDILLPAFAYWQSKSFYATGSAHGPAWHKKITQVTWRGASTGGHDTRENWARFHRHRFVTLMNASAIHDSPSLPTSQLPESCRAYLSGATQINLEVARWLDTISDVAFTRMYCNGNPKSGDCPYLTPYYEPKKEIPMSKQFRSKYLPDIDGNGFSGRYLAFLRSTSVPIKATLFSEWHDSRLVPWYHFVPMQNSFVDLYGILEYFVGWMGKEGGGEDENVVVMHGAHDEQAEKIAMQGKEWAEKVLRREDMLVYLLRLLLEYRRLCDDNREYIGWVADLL